MSVVISIGTAVPQHKHSQVQLAEYMSHMYGLQEDEKRKLKLLHAKSAIDIRYSVLSDFSEKEHASNFFATAQFPENSPTIDSRLEKYFHHAAPLAGEAIKDCITSDVPLSAITHLITVSCTGMSAPGIDVELIKILGLSKDIKRSSINFMGCYAALHGLQQADYICRADAGAKVLVVCVELCTLHFQSNNTLDNWVANSLFSDGAAAVIITSDEFVKRENISGFRLEKFHSQIISDGHKDMAWQISSKGFLMTLSAYIPQLIEQNLQQFLTNTLEGMNVDKDQISRWAIHPGGRKILDAVTQELALEDKELESAYETLRNYGNMSSPTILFVLKNIFKQQNESSKQQHTFAVAFGPGLVMESVLLKYV